MCSHLGNAVFRVRSLSLALDTKDILFPVFLLAECLKESSGWRLSFTTASRGPYNVA